MRDGFCLAATGNCLYHLGLKNVARSTVADANNSRPVGFFQDMLAECMPCAVRMPRTQISFQVQAVQHGRHHYRPLPFSLSHGVFPLGQGRGEEEHRARPCWLYSRLCRYRQGQNS